MSGFDEVALADLRGSLPASRNSSRDLAATAQTRCTRRRALAVVGADVEAAAELMGAAPTFGQSPIAIQAGDRFERGLNRDHYSQWFEALRELGFPVEAVGIVDLDIEYPWPHPKSRGFAEKSALVAKARRDRTDQILAAALAGRPGPVLVLHPRLRLEVTDTARDVEPDAWIIWPGSGMPRIAEVKAYVDLGHRTDTADLAKTRQQIAVYEVALEQAVRRLHHVGLVPDLDSALDSLRGPWPGEADVGAERAVAYTVLRRPQSMRPSIGREFVERDVSVVRRGLQRTPATLSEILDGLPHGSRLDDPEVLKRLPTAYEPAWCLGNCPIAEVCRSEARRCAHPSTFGGVTASVLAVVPDLERAHELATGAGCPVGEAEEAFAERAVQLRSAVGEARKAC